LDGRLTWEDFSLTFRMRLNRQPDVYQTLVQGFLIMEAEDLEAFCRRLLAIESSRERIPVEAGGCRYTVNRYCPHQGGDLSEGWVDDDRFLVCPRHRWRFDLHQGGRAEGNDGTIDAIALEAD
jgi:UDP-MurNAc hydroxylase